jgi:hypothetical protein
MSSSKIEYKIEKYVHKLKNAETLYEAETYQRRLRQYHRINQHGGVIQNKMNRSTPDQNTISLKAKDFAGNVDDISDDDLEFNLIDLIKNK